MKKYNIPCSHILLLVVLLCGSFIYIVPAQQKMDRIERERMGGMLKNIKNQVKKDYYDPTYHGIDIEARFKKAEDRLNEVATTGQAMGVIAQVLIDFNDSHLYFLPPSTNLDVEYGWKVRMYGEKCFVTMVQEKSDAQKQGLKPGDEVLAIEGFPPSRKELWKVIYYFNSVSKRNGLKLKVKSPGEETPRDLDIKAKTKSLSRVITRELFFQLFDTSGKTDLDYNYFVKSGNTAVWKMPSFDVEPSLIDTMMGKVKGSANLILDLRGNGGGLVVTLERLAGYIFNKDLTIAELKGRKPMDAQKSKTRGSDTFTGGLVVLLDANSGSASEIFARLVQLEKRGKVVGDVSAGAVMQSRQEVMSLGANDEILYGVSVTNADVIMSDGKSIEHVGVIPDELVLPTGSDLAGKKDPALARAIEILGGKISSEDAGKFFVTRWKENGDIIVDLPGN